MGGEAKLVESPTPSGQSITAGSVILACEEDDEASTEAKVTGIEGDVLSLEWQYYPEEPSVRRRVTQVSPVPLENHFWEL